MIAAAVVSCPSNMNVSTSSRMPSSSICCLASAASNGVQCEACHNGLQHYHLSAIGKVIQLAYEFIALLLEDGEKFRQYVEVEGRCQYAASLLPFGALAAQQTIAHERMEKFVQDALSGVLRAGEDLFRFPDAGHVQYHFAIDPLSIGRPETGCILTRISKRLYFQSAELQEYFAYR
uniref:Uncharacterized protein n=1 Tax=Anopheles culicifacies TaxID=139723 RepID=A0A182M4X6_9DIPT